MRLFVHRAVMTSDYLATARVLDDDRPPRATITPVSPDVAEGQTLRWRLTIDWAADYPADLEMVAVPVGEDAVPLSTRDLPRRYLRRVGIDPDAPPVPLAQTELQFPVVLAAGTTAATVRMPTALDERAEPREAVRLRTLPHPFLPEPVSLKGDASRPRVSMLPAC